MFASYMCLIWNRAPVSCLGLKFGGSILTCRQVELHPEINGNWGQIWGVYGPQEFYESPCFLLKGCTLDGLAIRNIIRHLFWDLGIWSARISGDTTIAFINQSPWKTSGTKKMKKNLHFRAMSHESWCKNKTLYKPHNRNQSSFLNCQGVAPSILPWQEHRHHPLQGYWCGHLRLVHHEPWLVRSWPRKNPWKLILAPLDNIFPVDRVGSVQKVFKQACLGDVSEIEYVAFIEGSLVEKLPTCERDRRVKA